MASLLPDAAGLGWLAAALTLLTFHCTDMVRLRVLALCANGVFVAYALTAGLVPVLTLHAVLIPLNLWRLRQACRVRHTDRPRAAPAPGKTAARASIPRLPRTTGQPRKDGCLAGLQWQRRPSRWRPSAMRGSRTRLGTVRATGRA
jgi:hypothetical protein